MKKIIIAMAAIAAAFTMASCSKDQPVSPNENPTVGKTVITASIENDFTKTTLEGNDDEGYKVFWSAGDQLLVADNEGSDWCAKYTLDDSSADSSTGTFSWKNGDFFFHFGDYDEPAFEEGTEYMALYPFDLYNLDDEGAPAYGLTWKTEQRYSETDRYIPMYSETVCTKDGDAEFKFANIGGLLRLTVKGTAKIRSIELRAAETMSGIVEYISYKSGYIMFITDDTHGGIHYVTLDCGKDGVELNDEEGTDFYFSLPCCFDTKKWEIDGYSDVTITLTDTEDRTCVKKLNNKKLVIERSKITTATFTASEWILPGKFSVAEGKQVQFSSGNLTCDISGEKPKWSFFEHQNDYTTGYDSNLISLFTWGYDANKSIVPDGDEYVNRTSGDLTQEEDWGSQIGDGKTWRTLTAAEWRYLINKDNAENIRKGKYKCKVTVCEKENCLVLAPDNFTGTIENTYDAAAWAIAEKAGLVCLPAAGARIGPDVDYFDELGSYWSSSAYDEDYVIAMFFADDYLEPNNTVDRFAGFSVRLVTNCK